MKLIVYYDPETGEILDIPWLEKYPPPPLIKPKKGGNGTHKTRKDLLARYPHKKKKS